MVVPPKKCPLLLFYKDTLWKAPRQSPIKAGYRPEAAGCML